MKKNSFVLRVMAGIFSVSAICNLSNANNIQVANVTLTGQNTSEHFTMVQFDLSWENSWHISDKLHEFWDASWIFVKYRIGNSDQWGHATLDNSIVVAPTGCTADLISDGKGAFIYRSEPGEGTNDWEGIQLKWLYGTDGLDDNAIVDVKVFAIEMVYVPEGSFWVGDGATEYKLHPVGDENSPFFITSEDQLTLGGTTPGNLTSSMYGTWNDFYQSNYQTYLNTSFPKGYGAFYCMKYEGSEGQYVDFLNCLTRTQQALHVKSDISGDAVPENYVLCGYNQTWQGSTVKCPETGNGTTGPVAFSSEAPERACNYINSVALLAYLDWAALRPMTCLEYEKACRGADVPPVPGDFAWGTNEIYKSNITVNNAGTADEYLTFTYNPETGDDFSNTNIRLKFPYQPFRCGIIAASATINDRIHTGAAFYGIMDMTGSLYEWAVPIESPEGRQFRGNHGDGELDNDGNANTVYWNAGKGLFRQGNNYYREENLMPVSYRMQHLTADGWLYGFRGVRTAE